MPHSPQHDGTIQLVHAAVRRPLDAAWELRIQSAITLRESEPEPDIAVVPGPAARYLQRHPGPLDIAMLIEFADTSLGRDRYEKGQVYASAGIVIYWIVNLADRCVEVYTDPSGPNPSPSFRQRRDYGVGDQVPLVIQGKTVSLIPVADMVA
jgi:Uma2 family endonuclease